MLYAHIHVMHCNAVIPLIILYVPVLLQRIIEPPHFQKCVWVGWGTWFGPHLSLIGIVVKERPHLFSVPRCLRPKLYCQYIIKHCSVYLRTW